MAKTVKTPGVYVEEVTKFPPSVVEVETAIPAFIGYTEKDNFDNKPLVCIPTPVKSLAEYVNIFGKAKPADFATGIDDGIRIKKENGEFKLEGTLNDPFYELKYRMYYSLQLFYANGGGKCYILSCGKYKDDNSVSEPEMNAALQALRKAEEPTIILFTDSVSLVPAETDKYYSLYVNALAQCSELNDRITLVDIYLDPEKKGAAPFDEVKDDFRNMIGNNSLRFGAVYYPWIGTTLGYVIDEEAIAIIRGTGVSATEIKDNTVLRKISSAETEELSLAESETSLYHCQNAIYLMIKNEIEKFKVISPPTPAIAGVYSKVDSERGVWKAPANVSLKMVEKPMVKIDNKAQDDMNVTPSGKSVNAIRSFVGKGVLVWGARTLAGNNNEFRYISVCRLLNMVGESVKRSSEWVVFEPNDANTWCRIKSMIDDFLVRLWRNGALAGARADHAFFVKAGLGETMTQQDIEEGRLIIEMGLAVTRPAEFIILRITHMMK